MVSILVSHSSANSVVTFDIAPQLGLYCSESKRNKYVMVMLNARDQLLGSTLLLIKAFLFTRYFANHVGSVPQ